VIASEFDHRMRMEEKETATIAAAIAAYGPLTISPRTVQRLI